MTQLYSTGLRYIFVDYMECGDKKVNEFIHELSKKIPGLKWRDVVRLAMKGYKK